VGVFATRAANSAGLGDTLYLKQHRLRSGRQTITVIVPSRPARAGVDPHRRFIERLRDDNVVEVGSDTTGSGG